MGPARAARWLLMVALDLIRRIGRALAGRGGSARGSLRAALLFSLLFVSSPRTSFSSLLPPPATESPQGPPPSRGLSGRRPPAPASNTGSWQRREGRTRFHQFSVPAGLDGACCCCGCSLCQKWVGGGFARSGHALFGCGQTARRRDDVKERFRRAAVDARFGCATAAAALVACLSRSCTKEITKHRHDDEETTTGSVSLSSACGPPSRASASHLPKYGDAATSDSAHGKS